MVSLRRDGFTMKAIAEKVGVSERTVRRYTRGVKPEIKMPSEQNSDEFTNHFYDKVLATRRRIVPAASEHFSESLGLGLDAVDEAMKSLRKLLDGMEPVSIRKLEADESLRAEFFDDFMSEVIRGWVSELNTRLTWRNIVRQLSDYEEPADAGDSGPR